MTSTQDAKTAHKAILEQVLPAIHQAAAQAGGYDVLIEELLCLLAQDTTAPDSLPDYGPATEDDLSPEAAQMLFEERLEGLQELEDIRRSLAEDWS